MHRSKAFLRHYVQLPIPAFCQIQHTKTEFFSRCQRYLRRISVTDKIVRKAAEMLYEQKGCGSFRNF